MKVQIFSASVNPDKYDLGIFNGMSFDEAVDFFVKDKVCCCNTHIHNVDLTKPNEFQFCCDGAFLGDGSDTMFVWTKVSD